ncbi:fluoride efflux transporter CrcB [Lentilactobacillus kosonis]|uniref:Fluoride-specific ion channel FluC n=1 Tax=Lentilactobacillus kosonis TaxID=2810561 RepID=A0A401FLX0_9LACO|nr:fluoride efflux transporter CrcB [Lentilactobacillus kosonis]GAY73306.1 CrcB protein [Lentilactobacillus kosonis]
MNSYLLIGLGAAVGAVARYDVTKLINRHKETIFPTATLIINLLGAFLLGIFTTHLIHDPSWLSLLGTGLCGGFTTFSTMANECLIMWQERTFHALLWYLSLTIIGGIGLATLGLLI